MAAENSESERDAIECFLDSQGKLNVSVDYGMKNAGRQVHLSVDFPPRKPELRGSRRHILDLLDHKNWPTQLNNLIAMKEITLSDNPRPIPEGHKSVAETDLDTYILDHRKGVWPQAEKRLDRGRWWAPHGGTRPQMDLICRLKVDQKDELLFVEAKAHEGELD
jgi:hypothetical protein